jgi:hypothetical protein
MEPLLQTDWLSTHYHMLGWLYFGILVAATCATAIDVLCHHITSNAKRRRCYEQYMEQALGVGGGVSDCGSCTSPVLQSPSSAMELRDAGRCGNSVE